MVWATEQGKRIDRNAELNRAAQSAATVTERWFAVIGYQIALAKGHWQLQQQARQELHALWAQAGHSFHARG